MNIRETVAETTAGLTSDMAETLVDSVVTELPSESEPDQATATSWTEGVGADDTYADDMNMGRFVKKKLVLINRGYCFSGSYRLFTYGDGRRGV